MSGTTLSVVLAERPVLPSQNEYDFKSGEILVCALKGDTYVPVVKIGKQMRGVVLAQVIASKNVQIGTGNVVVSNHVGWREEATLPEGQFEKASELVPGSEITGILGAYHWTGLTVYFELDKIGKPKAGETVVISGAAGAMGSIAGQLDKIAGPRVIGIAGGDENLRRLLRTLLMCTSTTPIGGESLEMALSGAQLFSRFVMSGSITQHNSATPTGPKAIPKLSRMQGFIVLDYADEFDDARRQLAQWTSDGKIHTRATIVDGGLKVAEQALQGIFSGANTGELPILVLIPAV
ncbi:uncharacterized protein NECHADRAFT_97387 [Fusarium vanettenii 77-13-4]|uniref:Oxidoreductase N-terminal domain-containing protein n=1 Tax=Fusarium vanettenii (strain ATCC MYA-4622 / CBS 123669 / FGSC 9596 / NRRL 45880 / 77-13-4) TaxID=660122 RepID=C7ZHV4_FUSV7|nr:uncharacterized protein NECHADRAFT_97387 [Fusarium vanettenii 77-13-4]EEU36279.1 hypothetical protein NECHADRAFT_97387 [Fusarium vanettenii 77-13-4]